MSPPLELQSQVLVTYPVWVLGMELGSFPGAASALSLGAASPASFLHFGLAQCFATVSPGWPRTHVAKATGTQSFRLVFVNAGIAGVYTVAGSLDLSLKEV